MDITFAKGITATIVSAIVVLASVVAALLHLPEVWAIDLLKMLLAGSVAWLLVDRTIAQVAKSAQVV